MAKENKIQFKKDISYAVKGQNELVTIKDVDTSKRIVTGIYNTYNFLDSDYDVILPGAAKKSISERGPLSTSVVHIKHLMFHDWKQLPGRIKVLQEKEVDINGLMVTGLYFETEMSPTTIGNDALINYQLKVYDNHSIGFQFLDGEYIDSEADDWGKVLQQLINPQKAVDAGFMYLWKEIKLYEGSTVAFGANELTPSLGVKDAEKHPDLVAMKVLERIELLGSVLKSGTQSDEMLQAFDMERLQLKQLIKELFLKGPSVAPTPKPGPGKKDTTPKMITCDACGEFDAQNLQPNSDGAYACPNCNTLCMAKSKDPMEFLSKLQFI